jgi:hypothetical protein
MQAGAAEGTRVAPGHSARAAQVRRYWSGKFLNWSGSDALNVAAETQAAPIATDGLRVGVLFPRTVISLVSGAPFVWNQKPNANPSERCGPYRAPTMSAVHGAGTLGNKRPLLILVARELALASQVIKGSGWRGN